MNHLKIPKTEYPISELIKSRWSARSFSDNKIVTEDSIRTIIEAGSWAFSANNEQPWRVITALKGTEKFDKILATLMAGNTPWAKNASAFVVSIAKTNFDKEGNPFNASSEHDLGAFNATMVLQAMSMDIYAHPMAGFYADKIKESFSLGEFLKPMVVIALGYLGEADNLEEPFLTREKTQRSRKNISEIIL
jgi:nitroreductase